MSQTLETKLLETLRLIEKIETELQQNPVEDLSKKKKMRLLREMIREQIPSLAPALNLQTLNGLKLR